MLKFIVDLVMAVIFTSLIVMGIYSVTEAPATEITALTVKINSSHSDKAKSELATFMKEHPSPTKHQLVSLSMSLNKIIGDDEISLRAARSTNSDYSVPAVLIKPTIPMSFTDKVLIVIMFISALGFIVMMYFRFRNGR